MPAKVSPTLKVLREIRDHVGSLDDRVGSLDDRVSSLESQQEAIATELTAVTSAVLQVRDLLADRLDQRDRIDDHEHRLQVLERKTG